MFKSIAIIEKSKIIRDGLETQLRTLDIFNQIISVESLEKWPLALKDSVPDAVIINPDLVRSGLEKLKTKFKTEKKVFFIAIVYLYFSHKELIEIFDDIIYITDAEEDIANKIKNLLNRKNPEEEKEKENEQLTSREKDVLRLLLQGLANKEVADKLSISTHTVITHRKNIIEKTGIRSLSGLAVYAILNNIADIDDLKN